MRALPAGAARIIRNSTQAMASATTEEIGAIHQTASMFDGAPVSAAAGALASRAARPARAARPRDVTCTGS